jgi:hypothetical protein
MTPPTLSQGVSPRLSSRLHRSDRPANLGTAHVHQRRCNRYGTVVGLDPSAATISVELADRRTVEVGGD